MPAFAQFVLVAVVLYLWESTLWMPLRGTALRRRRDGKRWKALDPGAWFAAREAGLIPMLPLPPDAGLAPCQAPPLLVDENGGFLIDSGKGVFIGLPNLTWNDLERDSLHLVAGGTRVRISSPRCMELLSRARKRGASPAAAVRLAWRIALSPGRAAREWRRWRIASASLRWYGPLLTLGFFAGLPLVYVHVGSMPAVWFALWLWCVMAFTAAHLWWLGKRVYPDARGAFRMDAALALLVPFHAMRAAEIASVHAMGLSHPAGMILSTGDFANPWLGRFIRRLLHPLPGNAGEAMFHSALVPLMSDVLSRHGKVLSEFDTAPDTSEDPEATGYCPRCHGIYQHAASACGDCPGVELRPLGGTSAT